MRAREQLRADRACRRRALTLQCPSQHHTHTQTTTQDTPVITGTMLSRAGIGAAKPIDDTLPFRKTDKPAATHVTAVRPHPACGAAIRARYTHEEPVLLRDRVSRATSGLLRRRVAALFGSVGEEHSRRFVGECSVPVEEPSRYLTRQLRSNNHPLPVVCTHVTHRYIRSL